MNVELSQRLALALDAADIDEREQLAAAAQGADTVEDLPPEARELLTTLEQRTRGDGPADEA